MVEGMIADPRFVETIQSSIMVLLVVGLSLVMGLGIAVQATVNHGQTNAVDFATTEVVIDLQQVIITAPLDATEIGRLHLISRAQVVETEMGHRLEAMILVQVPGGTEMGHHFAMISPLVLDATEMDLHLEMMSVQVLDAIGMARLRVRRVGIEMDHHLVTISAQAHDVI